MTRLPAYLYADLIGKPYAEGARGPAAYDCLGLALELQRRQGRRVPDFASTRAEFNRQIGEGVLGPCRQISEARPGCVVLLRMTDDQRHIGTMVDPWRMFHTQRDLVTGAAVDGLLRPAWQRRVLGFYMPEVSE